MNDAVRLGVLAAALILAPLFVHAQGDGSSGNSGDSNASETDDSDGAKLLALDPIDSLQPTTGQEAFAPSPEAVVLSGAPTLTVLTDQNSTLTGITAGYQGRRVSEGPPPEKNLGEVRRGVRDIDRGAHEENRGLRLIAAGEKTGGAQGSRLEAEGRAVEQQGKHEVRRGVRDIRNGTSGRMYVSRSSAGRAGHAARVEARRAARGASGSSSSSWGRSTTSATRASKSRVAVKSEKWQHP